MLAREFLSSRRSTGRQETAELSAMLLGLSVSQEEREKKESLFSGEEVRE